MLDERTRALLTVADARQGDRARLFSALDQLAAVADPQTFTDVLADVATHRGRGREEPASEWQRLATLLETFLLVRPPRRCRRSRRTSEGARIRA